MEHTLLVTNLERKLRHLKRDISRLALIDAGSLALASADHVIPLESALAEAEGYLKEFLTVWDERSNLQPMIKDDTFPSDQWLKIYDEIRHEIRQAKVALATVHRRHLPAQAEVTQPTEALNASMLARNNLPKISIPQFSGDLLSWRHFKDTFESIVHSEPSLSDIERFHYLLGALSGEASSMISGFPVESEYYQLAWQKLLNTYDNSRLLAKLHIQRILDSSVKGIRDEEKRLSKFLSTVAESIESFNRLNLERPEEFILSILALRALDENTRRVFELSRSSAEGFPTAKEVIDFITKRVTALKLSKEPTSSHDSFAKVNNQYTSSSLPRRDFRRYNGNSAMALHTTTTSTDTRSSGKVKFGSEHYRREKSRTSQFKEKVSHPNTTRGSPTNRSEVCPFCSGVHLLPYCTMFHEAGIKDRIGFVNGWKGCPNCLKADHCLSQCKSKWTCRYCKQKHHSLIHHGQGGPSTAPKPHSGPSNQDKRPQEQETFIGFGSAPRGASNTVVLLGTLQALIQGRNCILPVRAVLDSGSQHTFITGSLAERLNCPISHFSAHITGLGGASVSQPLGSIGCSIKPYNSSGKFTAQAVVVYKISPPLPSATINETVVDKLNKLELADHAFYAPGAIDLLIGMDLYPLIVTGAPSRAGTDDLFLLPTAFGLVVIGTTESRHSEPACLTLFTESSDDIATNLKAFWELEEPAPVTRRDPDDAYCEQHFLQTHSRDKGGRYIVRLPIKPNSSPLHPNRDLVAKRFSNLERKMEKDAVLSIKYKEFMKEYEDLGHMSLASASSGYIIPHHGVWQHRPEGAKFRVVFDASFGSESLNDTLLPGPKLQSDISNILINFRTYVIPLCTDIVKMYRQILVHPEDRHLQHVYWRNHPSEALLEYELNTVTYGVRPSAFLAIRVIRQLVEEEGSRYPLASSRVLSSMYVDDIVSGANTTEEVIELKRQLIELFRKGGFTLSKWSSTLKEILPEACDRAEQLHIADSDSVHQKILGLIWIPSEDVFTYVVQRPPSVHVTKRIILSSVARIFDPLGLLAPITFKAKALLQSVWKSRVDWDESLPDDIVEVWHALVSEWHLISAIKIPRYFGSHNASCRIVGFCDASEKGYAATVYIRVEHPDGSVKVTLVKAKTKVAPLKYVSIARLELCGALLLAKVLSSLDMSSSSGQPPICFTDSTVVLSWLRKPVHSLKVFEANRVAQVLNTTSIPDWHHVRSEDNPADIGSRGCGPGDLHEMRLWWNGPPWLSHPYEEWPPDIAVDDSTADCLMAINTEQEDRARVLEDEWMKRFSSYRTTVRTVARILRLSRRPRPDPESPISAIEFKNARIRCIQLVQRLHLPKALFGNLKVPNLYGQLTPFIDEDGIVRVGGRLNNAPLNACSRHPILIPRSSHLAKMIVDDVHQRHFHAGPTLVLALLRQEYWIMGAMKFIRGRIIRCVQCRLRRCKPIQPFMASLPADRFIQFRAFLQTGLDYTGPFFIKESTRRNASLGKAYLCIFICMATKAVHLEAVSSLSTPAFLSALDRFVARRGLPQKLHSDHGSNFIGASRFIKEVYKFVIKNEPDFVEYLAPRMCNGIPPGTPNFGGLWEAGVKSVKRLLVQSIGKHPYTFEELSTALTKIEGLLNSRPMYALTEDADDFDYLTPGHFLIGSSLSQIPDSAEKPAMVSCSARWQALRIQVCNVWNRWRTEYLHNLQQRKKWTKKVPNLKPGDLVILLEKRTMMGHWPVARVVQEHPGKDGVTRVVTVRTPSGKIFVRSACSLAPLFPSEASSTDHTVHQQAS